MNLISLDIETYGSCIVNDKGQRLPSQTVFNPTRSIETDHCSRDDLVLTCTITTERHSCPCKKHLRGPALTSVDMAMCRPCCTFTLHMFSEADRILLQRWLAWSTDIVGMNIPFDIQYLRAQDPRFWLELGKRRHILHDLAVYNYLHSELRPERSLKSLGPVLGTHVYSRTMKDGKFKSPHDKEFLSYAAQDTHNTLLACTELAKRIARDWPDTDKLSPFCIQHYSNTLWCIIQMSEQGIPMSRADLQVQYDTCKISSDLCIAQAADLGLQLEGTGSHVSKKKFLEACTSALAVNGIDILSNPLAQFTEKKKEFSFTESNRNLILQLMPPLFPVVDDFLRKALALANTHQKAQKLMSTYLAPLLTGKRNDSTNQGSVCIPSGFPGEGDSITYPSWYVVPSSPKDSAGSEGGTIQGRITCKNPSAQTFPPVIKDCIKSRFRDGTILSIDLSQIELRVAAVCSGDPTLLAAFNAGLDLHTDRAIQLFGPEVAKSDTFKSLERQVGKTMNFADLFLASPYRMRMSVHEMTGKLMPMSFFENVAATRASARPGLHAWQQSLIRTVDRTSSLVLPLTGHSRTFVGGTANHLNEVVNFPIQTIAGNLTLAIQNELALNCVTPMNSPRAGVHMFLQIYDAIYLDCAPNVCIEDLKLDIADAVKEVATNGYWAKIQEHYKHSTSLQYEIS